MGEMRPGSGVRVLPSGNTGVTAKLPNGNAGTLGRGSAQGQGTQIRLVTGAKTPGTSSKPRLEIEPELTWQVQCGALITG